MQHEVGHGDCGDTLEIDHNVRVTAADRLGNVPGIGVERGVAAVGDDVNGVGRDGVGRRLALDEVDIHGLVGGVQPGHRREIELVDARMEVGDGACRRGGHGAPMAGAASGAAAKTKL